MSRHHAVEHHEFDGWYGYQKSVDPNNTAIVSSRESQSKPVQGLYGVHLPKWSPHADPTLQLSPVFPSQHQVCSLHVARLLSPPVDEMVVIGDGPVGL